MKILHYFFFIIKTHSFIQNQYKLTCANCKFFIPHKNECKKFGDKNIITGEYTYEPALNIRKDEEKCGDYAIYFKKNNLKFITIPYYFLLENGKIIFLLSYGSFPFILWGFIYSYFIK